MSKKVERPKTAHQWVERLMSIIEAPIYEELAALHCIKMWSEQCKIEGVGVNNFVSLRNGFPLSNALPQGVIFKAVLSKGWSVSESGPRVNAKNIETLVLAIWDEGVRVDNINRDAHIDNPLAVKMTVLQAASVHGLYSLVMTSLERGASISPTAISGETALMSAALRGRQDIIRHLISIGSNINAQCTQFKNTALMLATESYEPGTVKLLMDLGADVHLKNESGNHALLKAASFSDREPVRDLIEGGADLNLQNKAGKTASHSAAENGYLDILKCLVEAGANALIPDKKGLTPLMIARDEGHHEMVIYLEGVEQALKDRLALEKAVPVMTVELKDNDMKEASKRHRM